MKKCFILSTHLLNNNNIIIAIPCNFTFVDIQASFGHVSHASLGLLGGKGAEVVNIRSLVSNLKVPNAAVALRTHSHNSSQFCNSLIIKKTRVSFQGYSPFHTDRLRWCRGHRRAAGPRYWSPSPEHILAHPCCPGSKRIQYLFHYGGPMNCRAPISPRDIGLKKYLDIFIK